MPSKSEILKNRAAAALNKNKKQDNMVEPKPEPIKEIVNMKPVNYEILQALAEYEGYLIKKYQEQTVVDLWAIAEYAQLKSKVLDVLKVKEDEPQNS